MRRKDRALTEKEKRFIELYIFGGEPGCRANATSSYVKAYEHQGSRGAGAQKAYDLLDKPRIKEEIQKCYEKKRSELTREWFQNKLDEIDETAKYTRDKTKIVELKARLEQLIGEGEQAGNSSNVFIVGIPRPKRDDIPKIDVKSEEKS